MNKSENKDSTSAPLVDHSDDAGRTERKLERLLSVAASLMAHHGYGQTSIRNVARETGYSLAGMYYYFENKEDLLYQIQHRTFASLLEQQERVVSGNDAPADKLRRLVANHLAYFTNHFSELKVCTFELETLQGERFQTIAALRKRYFACLTRVVGEICQQAADQPVPEADVRHRSLFIFGMLNWIFMWFDPARDEPVTKLGEDMVDLILNGLTSA
jgi:AcrR family transcriptional regulator